MGGRTTRRRFLKQSLVVGGLAGRSTAELSSTVRATRDGGGRGTTGTEPEGTEWPVRTGGPIHAGPAVVDGTAYVGKVYALDAETGEVRDGDWPVWVGKLTESSPVAVHGTVYVGNYDREVHSLDAETGEIR